MDNYRCAVWQLRDSLTDIVISDQNGQFDVTTGDTDSLRRELIQFPSLKNIKFYFSTMKTSLSDVFSGIHGCDSLVTLSIRQTNYITPEDFDKVHRDDLHITDFAAVKKHSTIKQLKGTGLRSSDNLIKYFTHVFPQLDKMDLQFVDLNLDEELNRLPINELVSITDTSVKFLLHVYNNIKTFNVERLLVDNVLDTADSFLSAINFNGTINIVYYNNEAHCRPCIDLSNSAYMNNTIFKVEFDDSITDAEMPHKILIQKYGSGLKKVCLDFGSDVEAANEWHRAHLDGHFLDYVFNHCPVLKCLQLENVLLSRCDPEMAVSRSIEKLVLNSCGIYKLPVLTQTSERLPGLSTLNVSDTEFPDFGCWNIDMPFTSFVTLSWINGWSNKTYENLRLRIITKWKTLYYIGDTLTMKEYSEDNYNDIVKTLDKDQLLSINIQCKSIGNVVLCCRHIKVIIINIG